MWQIKGIVQCTEVHNGNTFNICKDSGDGDGDLTFDLVGNKPFKYGPGRKESKSFIHCEMPNDGCYDTSPYAPYMKIARSHMRGWLNPPGAGDYKGGFCVTVRGLGFWDL